MSGHSAASPPRLTGYHSQHIVDGQVDAFRFLLLHLPELRFQRVPLPSPLQRRRIVKAM